MSTDIIFKKASFGGFDREEVIEYIAKITDEFQLYKNEAEKNKDKLLDRIKELELENEGLRGECDSLRAELAKAEECISEPENEPVSAEEIKTIISSLYENIGDIMSSLDIGEEKVSTESVTSEKIENDSSNDEELFRIIDKYVD